MPSKRETKQSKKSKLSEKQYGRQKKRLSHGDDPCDASSSTDPQLAGSKAPNHESSSGPSQLNPESVQFSNSIPLTQPPPTPTPVDNHPIYHSLAMQAMKLIPTQIQSPWDYLQCLPFFTDYMPPFLGSSGVHPSPIVDGLGKGKNKESDLESKAWLISIEKLAKVVADSMAEEDSISEVTNISGDNLDEEISAPAKAKKSSKKPASEAEKKEKKTLGALLKRRQDEFPNKSVKLLSFSDALPQDFECLAIEVRPTPIPFAEANQKIMTQVFAIESRKPSFTMDDAMKEFLMNPELVLRISQLSCRTNDLSEAFARKIIDQFTSTLYQMLTKMGLPTYEVAEFRIASASAPVEINVANSEYFTILTGTVDYAFFSSFTRSLRGLRKFGKRIAQGGKHRLACLASSGYADIQLFMIEAKSLHFSKSLAICMPQMAAECIATMKSSGKNSMAWCLSTGNTWIFGIIYTVQGGKYAMDWIAPMEFNPWQLDKSTNVEVVCNIFWAFAYWMLQPSHIILEAVFSG